MDNDREETLRKRAYEKWEADGRPDGEHERHWRDAESEFSTVGDEELADRDERENEAPTPIGDLPKVGEFSSANK